MCAIYNHKVELRPFSEGDQQIAFLEGEVDLSLDYWQKVHQKFFSNLLKPYNRAFKLTDYVVIEYFTILSILD